jgi:hypothetical protein
MLVTVRKPGIQSWWKGRFGARSRPSGRRPDRGVDPVVRVVGDVDASQHAGFVQTDEAFSDVALGEPGRGGDHPG